MVNENIYIDYKYEGKKRRRFSFFALLFVIITAGIVVMSYGIISSFDTEKEDPSLSVKISGVTYWTIQMDTFQSKSAAANLSETLKADGSAGYLNASEDGAWGVLDNLYATREDAEDVWQSLDASVVPNARIHEITGMFVEARLVSDEHRGALMAVVESFDESFKALTAQLTSYAGSTIGQIEITNWALLQYNVLSRLINDFDRIQEIVQSVDYAKVLIHANKQLLALYMLSNEMRSKTFESDIKNAICSVGFSHVEMLQSLNDL
jgi:hypothetical protein